MIIAVLLCVATNDINERNEIIKKCLSLLNEREKFIIESRFGLNGDKRETLESIGRKLKVTRERIRQIEKNALLKIKQSLEEINYE